MIQETENMNGVADVSETGVTLKRKRFRRNHFALHRYMLQLIRTSPEGTRLPEYEPLVRRFGVSRTVVRDLYEELSRRQRVVRIYREGTFVLHPRRSVTRLQAA